MKKYFCEDCNIDDVSEDGEIPPCPQCGELMLESPEVVDNLDPKNEKYPDQAFKKNAIADEDLGFLDDDVDNK